MGGPISICETTEGISNFFVEGDSKIVSGILGDGADVEAAVDVDGSKALTTVWAATPAIVAVADAVIRAASEHARQIKPSTDAVENALLTFIIIAKIKEQTISQLAKLFVAVVLAVVN